MNTEVTFQKTIMDDVTQSGVYLEFNLKEFIYFKHVLDILNDELSTGNIIIGFGFDLLKQTKNYDPTLLEIPTYDNPHNINFHDENRDVFLWIKDKFLGDVIKRGHFLKEKLESYAKDFEVTLGNLYHPKKEENKTETRGLDGFWDGTENPKEDIETIAYIKNEDSLLNKGSYWVVQKWQHDLDFIKNASTKEKEDIIGRTEADSIEFEHKPIDSHVARTDQDSFSLDAHMWRRSMPWISDNLTGGLMFTCFANSLYPFTAQFNRMTGGEDGIIDATFKMSQIVSTKYLWCPPLVNGKLNILK
ncbi:hypothetical protein CF386_08275 [Paraphotobacterium marinum]|uniref:Dyp-type peroxidase C-terminal domain-containing protein n=1 Tax=Paraphotobacterium marinum TaxID=1755811 RepID=A0A220VFB7_9GAMM|nr:Dyp-type peroxidase [Paraphotobacterium marinum]ASK79055.1 hypothetical protein CF386_08275 [Paraphotobacterium marinum]